MYINFTKILLAYFAFELFNNIKDTRVINYIKKLIKTRKLLLKVLKIEKQHEYKINIFHYDILYFIINIFLHTIKNYKLDLLGTS